MRRAARAGVSPAAEWALVLVAGSAFAVLLGARLAHPLLWQDEAETAMFATRVAEHGYPKVHGPRNVVYEFGPDIALGVKEELDAYIAVTWGQFYFAVPGVWWARDARDPYAKTFRLRLPFAAAGALGVLAWLWAVAPARRGRARLLAAAYLALSAASISLLLHLREVRYYPLLVLLLGAFAGVFLRRRVFRTLGPRLGIAAETALLFLAFHVFHPAWFVLAGLVALDAGWRFARGDARGRGPDAFRRLLPALLSGVAVAPFLVFFETFRVARGFADHLDFGPADYLANLGRVLVHLARYELLLPALAFRAANVWAARAERPRGLAAPADPAARVAALLLAGAVLWTLAGCANPLVYERYFVVVSPAFTLAFLLDAFALAERAPSLGLAAPRRAAQLAVGAALAAALATLAVRVPELRGRVAEIAQPVRGPLDAVVPWILARHPRPEELVIATNYEAHPLMLYLGSHVIVGLSANNWLAERGLSPDVVIPRRRWPASLQRLRVFLARGEWETASFPVADVHYNQNPSLSRLPTTPAVHRFTTPEPASEAERLVVHYRRDAFPERGAGAPATPVVVR